MSELLVHNLGTLVTPVLIFGGPYSNLQATQAIKQVADTRGIAAKNIICTGDIVAYCGSPEETVNLVRSWGCHVVMGNCEESIGFEKDDCGCGFEQGSVCETLSRDWYAHAIEKVSEKNKSWMRSLPYQLNFKISDMQFAAIHGGADNLNEFIFDSTHSQIKSNALDRLNVDSIIGGHCGIPFGQKINNRYWLNSGVIGMPANDGQTNTWYMLIEESEQGLAANWHKLEYDYERTMDTMAKKGFPNEYQVTLSSGIWPSMSILPQRERRLQGIPISMQTLPLMH